MINGRDIGRLKIILIVTSYVVLIQDRSLCVNIITRTNPLFNLPSS